MTDAELRQMAAEQIEWAERISTGATVDDIGVVDLHQLNDYDLRLLVAVLSGIAYRSGAADRHEVRSLLPTTSVDREHQRA